MILTGPRKLLAYPEVLRGERVPLSVQLSITGRCNLRCSYCVSHHTSRADSDMPIGSISDLLLQLKRMGTRTIELTGGGEPTLHPDFNVTLALMLQLGFQVGLVTNGSLLHFVPDTLLASLDWIRISVTGFSPPQDTLDRLAICYRTNKGLSLVLTGEPVGAEQLDAITRWREGRMHYLRVCKDVGMGMAEPFEGDVLAVTSHFGPDLAIINDCHRSYRVPERCLIGYYKPAISHTGQVYRCCTEFNGAGKSSRFHGGTGRPWSEMPGLWKGQALDDSTFRCSSCIYGAHNDLLALLDQPEPANKNFL